MFLLVRWSLDYTARIGDLQMLSAGDEQDNRYIDAMVMSPGHKRRFPVRCEVLPRWTLEQVDIAQAVPSYGREVDRRWAK